MENQEPQAFPSVQKIMNDQQTREGAAQPTSYEQITAFVKESRTESNRLLTKFKSSFVKLQDNDHALMIDESDKDYQSMMELANLFSSWKIEQQQTPA